MGVVSTMPPTSQTPTHREASARTPPKMRMGFSSPVGQVMPGTPTKFGFSTPTSQAVYAARGSYQGSHMIMSSPFHDPAGSTMLGSFTTSPCHSRAAPTPTNTPVAAGYSQDQAASSSMEALRSWLAGGSVSRGVDLVTYLEAAAPELYEE
jgi:hypothetical protein